MLLGLIILIAETVVFLTVYGWHVEAINGYEKFFDYVSICFMCFGFGKVLRALIEVTNFYLKTLS